ncbi:MAG: right-handed parallel beta-helix repeat-containing protein, partial [Ignavibacteria bacterium]|nr:right-handed parallel beta-helix repeat-containing protein [Ignavibacteria bacterium]
MRKLSKTFMIVIGFIVLFSEQFLAQQNNRGKSFYTNEEVIKMCGVPMDSSKIPILEAKQDSMYKDYKSKKGRLQKTLTAPNWKWAMSDVQFQEGGSCWVHAATGVAEGQLQILYGSRIGYNGINMNELEVPGALYGGSPYVALNYIQSNKISSEVGAYPNYQNAKWTILTHNDTIEGITEIKNALTNGPVSTSIGMYSDFSLFFQNQPTAVYHKDSNATFLGGHSLVIVSYDDAGEYWLCKNSWGFGWADSGYCRIGYGEVFIEVYENSSVTVNQDCYAKLVPDLQSFSNAMNSSWASNEWAYVLSNTTINSGVSVTVPSNGDIVFANNTSLTVNGTLTATGTSPNHIMFDRSGTSGTWNGIVFNSGSSGSIEYCDISHATTGITSSYTLPMIRYNTITNNATGIYVSNVGTPSNEISYNTIQSNTYQGISLYYASPKIYSNTISGNAYYGISCRYYSSPYLYGNTITGHPSSALSCYYYSSAKLVPWNAYGYYWGRGNNKIKNNTGTGITASYWSNLFLGSSPYGGYNSICNNTGYELSAYYGCTVTAQLNWWGAYPPNSSEFYAYQSTIDYTNALQTDPNPDPEQGMVRGPNGISNSSTINSAKSDLDKAYGLQSEGKFDEAIAVYDSYINANPTDSKSAYALIRIDECYKLSGKEGAATYLDNTIKTKANKNNELNAVSLELKNQYLIQDKRFEEAVNNLNKLAETYNTNKEVEKHSLFNAGYVYLKY